MEIEIESWNLREIRIGEAIKEIYITEKKLIQ